MIYYSNEQGTIYNGDSIKLLLSLESESVEGVVTDPPYSSGGLHLGARQAKPSTKYSTVDLKDWNNDNKDQLSFYTWCYMWLSECFRVTKEGGLFIGFIDWRQLAIFSTAVQTAGWTWRGIVPWNKKNSRPRKGGFRQSAEFIVWASKGSFSGMTDAYLPGVLNYPAVSHQKRTWLTEKPLPLLEEIVTLFPKKATILDPFSGSGTTVAAAQKRGCNWIAMEQSENGCQLIKERLEKLDVTV